MLTAGQGDQYHGGVGRGLRSEEFDQVSRVEGFWVKLLNRILAKIGLYRNRNGSPRSGLLEKMPQRSLTTVWSRRDSLSYA